MTYADVSRGIQRIFKERQEPLTVAGLEAAFVERFGVTIYEVAGISTSEYLLRKENVFEFDEARDHVFLQPSILAGPPIADPNLPKDEKFVIDEFERLIDDLGPVCYVSALCGKFIQRNGVSVTSITHLRPLDLFKRYPDRFLVVGGGNVTLAKYKDHPEVQGLVLRSATRVQRTTRAQADAKLPVPEVITEEAVVEEFRRLIEQDGSESVYISSLCGRFLQRFRKPVTAIISSRPADFLRKYPEVFELVGGGNVKLRDPKDGPSSFAGVGAVAAVAGEAAGKVESGGGSSPAKDGADSIPEDTDVMEKLDDSVCRQIVSQITPAGLMERLTDRVQELADLLRERCFLTIEDIVVSGTVGKGIATLGSEEAEITLFVDRLPEQDHDKWLPHVLETLVAVLEMALGGRARNFRTVDGLSAQLTLLCDPLSNSGRPAASMRGSGGREVLTTIFISPMFESREQLFECLREAAPAARRYYSPSLARDTVELVRRQPEHTRTAMQLLRWWAAQQPWQSMRAIPTGYLLELLTIQASLLLSLEGGPNSSSTAAVLERALDLCGNFLQLRVLWNGTGLATFASAEVPIPLASKVPLVLDPTNPCANVADPDFFDGTELASRASGPRRLACFSLAAGKNAAEPA
jgi:hypothetical protein